jgi:hypothetical protein
MKYIKYEAQAPNNNFNYNNILPLLNKFWVACMGSNTQKFRYSVVWITLSITSNDGNITIFKDIPFYNKNDFLEVSKLKINSIKSFSIARATRSHKLHIKSVNFYYNINKTSYIPLNKLITITLFIFLFFLLVYVISFYYLYISLQDNINNDIIDIKDNYVLYECEARSTNNIKSYVSTSNSVRADKKHWFLSLFLKDTPIVVAPQASSYKIYNSNYNILENSTNLNNYNIENSANLNNYNILENSTNLNNYNIDSKIPLNIQINFSNNIIKHSTLFNRYNINCKIPLNIYINYSNNIIDNSAILNYQL